MSERPYTIVVQRHGRSDWPESEGDLAAQVTDKDRPLRKRGKKDLRWVVAKMAELAQDNKDVPSEVRGPSPPFGWASAGAPQEANAIFTALDCAMRSRGTVCRNAETPHASPT